MKKLRKLPDLYTFGGIDMPAAAILIEIVKEYHNAGDERAESSARKAFQIISAHDSVIVELSAIGSKHLRAELYNLYFKKRFKPLLDEIEVAGYKSIRSHTESILKAKYRKKLLGHLNNFPWAAASDAVDNSPKLI